MARDDVPGHHQHARSAEAALQRVFFVEMTADDVHGFAVSRALDSLDLAAIAHHREHDAGAHHHSVDRHSAGAAGTMFTAKVGTGQIEALAQEIRKAFARI